MGLKEETSAFENSEYLGDGAYIAESCGLVALYSTDGIAITNLVWLDSEMLAVMGRWILKHRTGERQS